jgi:outer membrane protein OmpA-like peptidoglycan-associated protein
MKKNSHIFTILSWKWLCMALTYSLFFLVFLPKTVAQTEKDAILLLNNNQFDKAITSFQTLIKKEPKNALVYFGLAKAYYEKQQQLKKSQPQNVIKYRTLQPHISLLKQAYQYAQMAAANYTTLTAPQKETFKMFSVSETQLQSSFSYTIESEAFNLLNTVPYRNSFEQLYTSQVYNKELDADTLLSLRDALHDQLTDFLATYKNVTNAKVITQLRKDLFIEMLNPTTARRYGDKGGKIYEQHCELILKYYSGEELKNILPTFYGFYFSNSTTNQATQLNDVTTSIEKITELAAAEKMTPLELLCKLNLHNAGCGTDNKALYDKFIRKIAPADIAFIALQRMASNSMQQKKWLEATNIYKTYQSLFPDNRIKKILDLLNTPDDNIELVNLGSAINSPYNDYSPVLAADGTLYFARKNENTGEDIFMATAKISKENAFEKGSLDSRNIKFENAQILAEVSTKSHEIPLSVSIDGKTLVLFGNYSGLPEFYHVLKTEKKLGKGDIYYVNKKGKKFEKVEVFPSPVNTENYEADLSITPDNKAVLFCSDRKGALGGYLPNYPDNGLYYHGSGEFNTDIWVAVRNDKNGFDEPINLGAKINTPFAEKKPFLHPDMKTLYFCSEGHHGFGGYDIFMAKRLNENSWTEWSEPINLGKIINSPFDDSFYISPTGELALIVSEKGGNNMGKLDIYQMTVPQRFRPEPVTTISGIVNDDKGKPIQAKIIWKENNEKNTLSSNNFKENISKIKGGDIETDENGNFYFVVPQSKNYIYYAEKDGYFGGGLNINPTPNPSPQGGGQSPNLTQSKENGIKTSPLGVGGGAGLQISTLDKTDKNRKPFVMRSLNFDHNSDIIRTDSYFDLYRLAALLLQNPQIKLAIEGHTDNAGTHEFNEDLSQRRAKAVLNFLVKNGVKITNITSKGFGETVPIADNNTEIGKEKNRRVEFKVIE